MTKANNVSTGEFTRALFRGNGGYFLLAVLHTVTLTCANLMLSWLMQQLIDLATGANTGYSLAQLAILSVCSLLLLALAFVFTYHATPRFIANAIGAYKNLVFSKIAKKNIAAFSKENTAFYVSALSNDANTIETNYLANIFNICNQGLLLAGALGMMLWYSPTLTLVCILLSILPILCAVAAGGRVAEAEKAVSEKNESYMSTLRDSLAGFSVVKAFQAETAVCRIFAQKVRQVSDLKCRRRKAGIWVQGLSAMGGCIAQVGIFLFGAYLAVVQQSVSAGVVIVFVQLMNFLIEPIGAIPQYLAEYKAAQALIGKVAQALNQNIRDEGIRLPAQLKKGIEICSLSFAYAPDKPVLNEINFKFEAGKSYAVVGASGCGKSTLLNLLLAAHDQYSGSILYDGMEQRTISSQALYELISIIEQNVFVFNASIVENITMFRPFPQSEIDSAIKQSGLSALIAQRGPDYLCGENGAGLSGGERQRISIARSLLRKSRVLLADEITAALDAETAKQVSNAVLSLEGLTRIVVTHKLDPALAQYDCIVVLKAGRIVQSGSFDALMASKDYFYSLYTVSQS